MRRHGHGRILVLVAAVAVSASLGVAKAMGDGPAGDEIRPRLGETVEVAGCQVTLAGVRPDDTGAAQLLVEATVVDLGRDGGPGRCFEWFLRDGEGGVATATVATSSAVLERGAPEPPPAATLFVFDRPPGASEVVFAPDGTGGARAAWPVPAAGP